MGKNLKFEIKDNEHTEFWDWLLNTSGIQLKENQHYHAEVVEDIVCKLHDDYYEGDLADRIYEFDYYKFIPLELEALETPYYIDYDVVYEYATYDATIPPIFVGKSYEWKDKVFHTVEDGGHRVTAAKKLGNSHIWGFAPVGEC